MIDLRQLEALRAVHSAGSVAAAARRLGWSQPTVDYHLRALDRLVGAPLLQRSTRGSTLTPVGALVLERGAEILALAERALADARSFAETGRVRLRFGTFPTAAASLLPSIAADVGDHGIRLDVTLAEVAPLIAQVNRSELDAALVYSVPGYTLPLRSDVTTTELWRDPLYLALPESHPLAERTSVDLDTLLTLSDERWLLGTTEHDPMDQVVVDAFSSAGRSFDVSVRTDDFSVMLGIIAAGMVIGLVPRMAFGGQHPGVALRAIDDPSFARTVLLAAPREGHQRLPATAMRHLAAAVRRALAEFENR